MFLRFIFISGHLVDGRERRVSQADGQLQLGGHPAARRQKNRSKTGIYFLVICLDIRDYL